MGHFLHILLISILLILCFENGSGQTNVYHSIPDSGAVWRIDEVDGSYPSFPYYSLSYYQYHSMGDTMVNGTSWIKIFISGNFQVNTPFEDLVPFPGYLRALIRMDTINGQLIVQSDPTLH